MGAAHFRLASVIGPHGVRALARTLFVPVLMRIANAKGQSAVHEHFGFLSGAFL
jgi:hypothetical protein